MKTFTTHLSPLFIVITSLVGLLLLWAVYNISKLALIDPYSWYSLLQGALALSLLFALCYTAVIQPRYLEVTDESLIIHRFLGKVVINRNDILFVERKKNMKKDIRTFGSGGFCGCLGYFYSQAEGKYFAYVRDLKTMVYIQTRGLNYVVSCDEPDEFIKMLNE